MANVICIDFDGTIATRNIAVALFEKFAASEWKRHREAYRQGLKTMEQYGAAALDLIEAPVDVLLAYVREITQVREGFLDLIDWAHWNGWLPMVLSNGFDFYVDAILDDLKLDRVTRHAARARFDYRWRATYFSPRGVELQDGFKLSYVSALRGTGDFVVYVGDGVNDVPGAKVSHQVFARDDLLQRLRGDDIPVYPFETFGDVVAVLDREAGPWLASFSSTTAAAD